MDEECYGECDYCMSEYDPAEHGEECDCGGEIQLIECENGCDYCS